MIQSGTPRGFAALALVVLGIWSAGIAACEDDPFGLDNWEANPDTALLYSLAFDELNVRSAFDFTERRARPIEVRDSLGRFNNWDVALDTESGQLVLLPTGALGLATDSRIAEMMGLAFDQVIEAPSDTTLYVRDRGVTLSTGNTYVVRTRQVTVQSFFASQCVFYAKLQPLRVDVAAGELEFLYDVNAELSGCNNRDLVPPN